MSITMELLTKNIINQQKEERDLLLSLKYINRLKEKMIESNGLKIEVTQVLNWLQNIPIQK